MTLALKICLACSGIFLLTGMLAGVVKYRFMMAGPTHRAPVYINIAHRTAMLYSVAALVMAELLRYNPYPAAFQIVIAGIPLFCFATALAQYLRLGFQNTTDNQFSQRTLTTTWGMYALIAGEIGGIAAILWGFLQTQFFS